MFIAKLNPSYYIVASCYTFPSITISSPSCVQTLVSSSHSHLKCLKLLKFLKVLKKITCFGQYGHPQVLKFLVGETAAIVCVSSMRMYVCNMRENIFLESLYVKFLCIVWLLVCVLTVLGVLLPVAFSCLFCFLMLAGLVWFLLLKYDCVAICCFLLVLFRISGCGCRCMHRSFVFRIFSSYIYI
jgi:hypothetical protein